MKQKSNIPSDEDFSRAEKKMKERLGQEANFKNQILSGLSGCQPCHDVWIWSGNNKTTVSYIFPSDEDLNKAERNGIERAIKTAARAVGIEQFSIEYHSHEHVLKKHNGDYDKYFR